MAASLFRPAPALLVPCASHHRDAHSRASRFIGIPLSVLATRLIAAGWRRDLAARIERHAGPVRCRAHGMLAA